MYDRIKQRIAQVAEYVDAIKAIVDQRINIDHATKMRAEILNRIYEISLHMDLVICSHILDDDDCQDEIDVLYSAPEDNALIRGQLRSLRARLIGVIMTGYRLFDSESIQLMSGRVSLVSHLLLRVAGLLRVELSMVDPTETYSRDFACARKYALVATEEQRDCPIETLSVHGLMNALHAIYAQSPAMPFTEELERYTGLLLRRGLDLLMTPASEQTWNLTAYREQTAAATIEKQEYRFSALMLRDMTILWHAFSARFDLAHMLPRCHDPRSVCEPSSTQIGNAREWLLRHVSHEIDTWVRDHYVNLSMRPGEMDFYRAEHRAEHSTPHLVLREHRTADYSTLMLDAQSPSLEVLRQHLQSDADFERVGPRARREHLHVTLVLLSTFRSRIKAVSPSLDTNRFVLFGDDDMRFWAPYIVSLRERCPPMLVLLHNHLQLWHNGRLLMYNNALEALCAWMHAVDAIPGHALCGYSMSGLVDDFLRPHESKQTRLARVAAQNSEALPSMGNNGTF